jgi:hypothetical protein
MEDVADSSTPAETKPATQDYFESVFLGNWRMFGAFALSILYAHSLGGIPLAGLVIGCLLVFMVGCDTIVKAINKKESK